MTDVPHDFYPEDQRVLRAEQLPDGRWHCKPPYVDPSSYELIEFYTGDPAALDDAGYELKGQ